MPSYFIKTKWVHNLVTIYLITFISSCTTPPRSVKPPTSVARAMETRSFEGDLVTILKASINSLQDMDYTIDVLNSDIGLISASRTSERRKANLANENNNSEQMSAGEQACLVAGGFVAIVILIPFLILFLTETVQMMVIAVFGLGRRQLIIAMMNQMVPLFTDTR